MRAEQKSLNPRTGNQYPVRFVVQVSDDMAERVVAALDAKRMTLSEFLREAIEGELKSR